MNLRNDHQNIKNISILIPDAEDWLTVKVLRCLGQESNYTNHILSQKKMPLSRFSRYSKSYHYNKSKNDDEWIEIINKLIVKLKIDVIIPVTVKGVELISKNRDKISKSVKIPALPEPEKIALTNDKWEFYKFLCQHDLPSIPTVYAGKSGEAMEVNDTNIIEYPALLKPISEGGGCGIVKVDNKNNLEKAWHDAQIVNNEKYILQSYIPSDHFSFSIYSREGEIVAYTIYKSLLQTDPYRIGVLQEFKNDDKIIEIGSKLISDLKWNGVANIDFLVDKRDNSVTILEFNPRFWQSLLGSESAGINFPIMYCLDTLGEKSSFSKRQITYANTSMYVKTWLNLLRRKQNVARIRWRESGMRYLVADPLPQLIEIFQKSKCMKMFKSLFNGKNDTETKKENKIKKSQVVA